MLETTIHNIKYNPASFLNEQYKNDNGAEIILNMTKNSVFDRVFIIAFYLILLKTILTLLRDMHQSVVLHNLFIR